MIRCPAHRDSIDRRTGTTDGRRAAGRGWRVLLTAALLAAPALLPAQNLECDFGDLEVQHVVFVGRHKFTSGELEDAIVTSPSSWLRRSVGIPLGPKRCLDTLEVQRDVLRLRIYYRLRGYYNATVRDSIVSLSTTAVNVRFLISEGPPTIVDSVALIGLELVPFRDAIARPIERFKGRTFSRVALQGAIDSAVVQLLDGGYPYTERPLTNFNVDSTTRKATVELTFFQQFRGQSGPLPGTPARVLGIDVAPTPGADSGRVTPKTVRALLYLKPGRVYSQEDVIASQRGLYELELARHVDIGLLPDSAQPSDTSLLVSVRYTEAKERAVRIGGGWATLDCLRAQMRYSDRDLFGGAERFDFNFRISHLALCTPQVKQDPLTDSLNYYVSGTLRMPTLFGPRIQPSITLFSERTSEYAAYFRVTPIGSVVALNHDLAPRGFRPGLPLSLSARLEYGHTDAQPAVFCQLFNLCSEADIQRLQQNNLLLVLAASLTHDQTNSLLNASTGAQQRIEFRYGTAQQDSGSPSHWTRLLGEAGIYRTFGSSVIAARLQIAGLFQPWTAFKPATDYVPAEERLYAGGPNSVRGFGQNLLGPIVYIVDTTHIVKVPLTTPGDTALVAGTGTAVQQYSATGGNAQLVATLEWRITMPKPTDMVQFAAFVDAGYVWNRGAIDADGNMVKVDLSQVKYTPGMGLRYLSKVGPIRVDFAYNGYGTGYGAAYYTDAAQVLHCVSPGNDLNFGIPAAGQTCPTSFKPAVSPGFFQRLTFNFSIGQSF